MKKLPTFLAVICCTCLIFVSSYSSTNNFTDNNHQKALSIFNKMVNYHGDLKTISSVEQVLTDYDHSTNYKTQGYGYQGRDYHSNRPGNLLSFISLKSQMSWSNYQYQYMESVFSKTTLTKDNKTVVYNDVRRNYQERESSNFNKSIENPILRNPILLINNVIKHKDNIRFLTENQINEDNTQLLSLTLTSGKVVTAYIKKDSGQLRKIEYITNNKLVTYQYSKYQRVDQFTLPHFIKITMAENTYPVYFLYHVAGYNFSPDAEESVSVPQDYLLAEVDNTYDGKLRTQTIGKGIYWVTQNGGNSLFVEFEDHVMAVDALGFGLSERINRFREIIADKPITSVSISHHHHDHFDAIPYYVENHATIITAEEFIPLLTNKIKTAQQEQPHKSPIKPANFDIVAEKKIVTDSQQSVEIYKLKNTLHADTMLMTYFPNEQLIYLPDHYESGYIYENRLPIKIVLDEIKRLNLKVKGFITGHGNKILSWETLQAAKEFPLNVIKLRRKPHQSVLTTQ